MADKLSVGSSQVFLATLVDLNNMPVAASSIHLEGRLYTSTKSKWDFETNMGVTKGCEIFNDMLLLKIDPKLGAGNMRVYTMVHTGSAVDKVGITDAENDQPLDVSIVSTGTYIGSKQGPIGIIIKLNTIISDKSQLPWSLPGQSVQAIKDEMTKYMSSPEFIGTLEKLGVADNKLSNVSDNDFKEKGKTAGMVLDDLSNLNPDVLKQKSFDAGMMGKDMDGVELEKLKEACFKAGMLGKDLGEIDKTKLKEILLSLGILKTDMSNVSIDDLDRIFTTLKAYKALADKKNVPVSDVASRIHYVEEQGVIDFATIPHEFIHAVYQFTKPKQIITQTLPDADLAKTIIIQTIGMMEDCQLIIKPAAGQMISGSPKDIEINFNGMQGTLYPETSGNYDFVNAEHVTSEAIPVQDEKGNIITAKAGLKFKGASVSKTANNEAEIDILPTEFSNENGGDGTPARSVTAEYPLQFTPKGKGVSIGIKRGSLQKAYPDAYYAALSEPLIIHAETNKLHKGNIWFDDVIYNHGPFIQTDKTTKTYGIQEDDELDPNVTGGTLAFVIVRLSFKGTAKQDGKIILELTDPTTGEPITYLDGRKASIRRDYKKDQSFGYIQMAFPFEAQGLQLFQVEVKHNFEIDEVMLDDRINGNSCILISYAHNDNQINPAVIQFEQDTNQKLLFQKNYFGADLFDMKYLVQNNVGEKVIIAGTGGTVVDGAHFYNNTVMSTEVKDGVLKFIGDAPNDSFFTFGKIFSTEKTIPMREKIIKVDVVVVPPTTPAEVTLYSWIGESDKYDPRIYGEIVNKQPVLVSGWTVVGSRDLIEGYDNFGMEFTVPSNTNNYAVCIHPKDVTNVTEINVTDLKVSAKVPFYDIQFDGISEIGEKYQLDNTRKAVFGVDVTGYAGLRYSVGIGETKIPVGWLIPSMSDTYVPVKLNPKWKDNVGHKGEGVLEVTRDCRIKNLYAILRMFGSDEKTLDPTSIQTVQVYFAKEDSTGINPIEQTRTSFQSKTAEAPKYVSTNKGTAFQPIELKKGEFIWLYAICNFNDGAYFKTTKKGQYLVQTVIEWEEIEESPVVPLGNIDGIKLVEDGKEVDKELYNIELDVKTGAIKVTKK